MTSPSTDVWGPGLPGTGAGMEQACRELERRRGRAGEAAGRSEPLLTLVRRTESVIARPRRGCGNLSRARLCCSHARVTCSGLCVGVTGARPVPARAHRPPPSPLRSDPAHSVPTRSPDPPHSHSVGKGAACLKQSFSSFFMMKSETDRREHSMYMRH